MILAPKGRIQLNGFPLYCSFCGKRNDQVGYLVCGPTVFICNECVELCREIGATMLVENATALSSAQGTKE